MARDGLHVLNVVIEIAFGHHTCDIVFVVALVPELAPFPELQRNIPGFILVQHLLGFLASCAIWEIAFYSRLDKCHRLSQIFHVSFADFYSSGILASFSGFNFE